MWQYIINWCLTVTVSTSCPDAIIPDEFGRISNPMTTCAALHTKQNTDCSNTRVFDNRKEAFEFYDRILEETKINAFSIYVPRIHDVKIDSIYTIGDDDSTSFHSDPQEMLQINGSMDFHSNITLGSFSPTPTIEIRFSPTPTIEILGKNNKTLALDFSGDTLKVSGDFEMDSASKIFIDALVKQWKIKEK